MIDKDKKGTYKYVSNKRIKLLIYLVITILIALAIFFTGYFLSGKSNKNLGTIMAVLMVLPGAKIFVTYSLLLPFRGLNKEQYNKLCVKVDNINSGCLKGHYNIKMLYGLVLTSPQQVMYIDALAITNDRYVILTNEKSDKDHMGSYLKKHMYNYGYEKEIDIYTKYDEFVNELDCDVEMDEERLANIISKLMILEV